MAAPVARNFLLIPKAIQSFSILYSGRTLNITQRTSLKILSRMAGHSHWANIKFKKMHADLARSKLFGRISMEIITAVRESGPDPTFNSRLEKLIEHAKAANMPKNRIEGAIKSGAGAKDNPYSHCIFEAVGPGACGLVIDLLTMNRVKAKIDINSILKKNGGQMKEGGSVLFQYENKGIVTMDLDVLHESDEKSTSYPTDSAVSKAEELAIESGAEDLYFTESEDSKKVIRFVCSIKDMKSVSDQIMAVHPSISLSTCLEYMPTSLVTLTENQLRTADKLIDLINDNMEVIKVYDNIDNYASGTCKLFAGS